MLNRVLLCIILFISCLPKGNAKDTYDISIAVGLEEIGINKVLCMKNGYTLLFHFENNKAINLKVFDTLHKKVANVNHSCNILDVMMLTTSVFKGLHEINGEAVLFFEQQNSGRHSLVRLRFDPIKGRLIEEKTLGKSQGLAKPMHFFVMKHRGEDGYEVLYCQDAPQFRESKIHVSYYNNKHEQYKEVPIDVDRKKYDYMHVVGAESLPEGVCVSFGLSNMLVNGTGNTMGTTPVYSHFLNVFYIPKDSTRPKQRVANLSSNLIPYYTNFTYNPFADKVNLMLLSYTDALYQNGIDMQPTALISNLLFKLDVETFSANYNWLTNEYANNQLMAAKAIDNNDTGSNKTDTTIRYKGFPVKMLTNNNGLSTMVSESYERYVNTESYLRSQVYETYLGNICITQFDDDGKELWGTVLPKSQYYKSYRQYYRAADLAKKWQHQAMFNDMPPQVYERQFVSTNVYNHDGNFYIIFNDCDKNLKNTIEDASDTVYTSALSNVCVYKINKKKEVVKTYLLGEPLAKEYKSSFVEGADFDEQRGVYASLIRYKRGTYVSLRMAWVKME